MFATSDSEREGQDAKRFKKRGTEFCERLISNPLPRSDYKDHVGPTSRFQPRVRSNIVTAHAWSGSRKDYISLGYAVSYCEILIRRLYLWIFPSTELKNTDDVLRAVLLWNLCYIIFECTLRPNIITGCYIISIFPSISAAI
jgi:hypothetical protein